MANRDADKSLRCAVIGAGWWGTAAHLPALAAHPRAEIVALQHPDRRIARQTAADFHVPHACATLEETLAVAGLDAVVISSTPNAHYAQAKASLERGLHVLIEKPMTITAREADELVRLADRQGVQFVLSAPWHYTRRAAEARKIIADGLLGPIKLISVLMSDSCGGLYRGRPWREIYGDHPNPECEAEPYRVPELSSYSDPAVAGGGQIYCQVSHAAAYVTFLTGLAPREVFARFDNADTAVDVFNSISAMYEHGVLVSLASAGETGLNERSLDIRVYGLAGELSMELYGGRMRFVSGAGEVRDFPDLPPDERYPKFAPAENLVDAALGLRPNHSPARLGLSSMLLIDAACRSARNDANILVADVLDRS